MKILNDLYPIPTYPAPSFQRQHIKTAPICILSIIVSLNNLLTLIFIYQHQALYTKLLPHKTTPSSYSNHTPTTHYLLFPIPVSWYSYISTFSYIYIYASVIFMFLFCSLYQLQALYSISILRKIWSLLFIPSLLFTLHLQFSFLSIL